MESTVVGVVGLWLVVAVLWFGLALLLAVLAFRDARRRGATDTIAIVVAVAAWLTMPIGPLAYLVLASTGALDDAFAGGAPAARTGTTGPEAGWYDDPEGRGTRYWDGSSWTEHTQGAH